MGKTYEIRLSLAGVEHLITEAKSYKLAAFLPGLLGVIFKMASQKCSE